MDANSKLFNHLHQIKTQNDHQLIGRQTTSERLKTGVTVTEKFPLSNSEKSALNKGFYFVLFPKNPTNF